MYTCNDELMRDARDVFKEHNDCTVRAFTAATLLPYAEVHGIFANVCGRQRGRGVVFLPGTVSKLCAALDVEAYRLSLRDVRSRYGKTVRTFARNAPTDGVYILTTSGHALCVRGGVAWDWADNHTLRLRNVYQIEPNGQDPSVAIAAIHERLPYNRRRATSSSRWIFS